MAKKTFWVGMLVLLLVFGMTVVGCDTGNGDNGTTDNGHVGGPGLTITGIPAEHNGRHAFFMNSSYSFTDDTPLGHPSLWGFVRFNETDETFTLGVGFLPMPDL